MLYCRALLLLVSVLILTANSAFAWSGRVDYGWNNKISGAEFWQADGDPVCATTNVVQMWTGNQVLFDASNPPPNKKFSWLHISVYVRDCNGYTSDEMHLYADLSKKPADKKDVFTPEEFAQDGKLRVSMLMQDYYTGKSHNVRVNMMVRGGTLYLYSFETVEWGYAVMYSFPTAEASLVVDNKPIMIEALSTPSSGYTEATTYVRR
ncbi:MAG: hypothetical protein A3J54_00360 [Candidatus Ryanbacteria bacterium RIFCSPHIGHO2_02_FULL_45_13b]|uniref:Uncharacterized protein n=1 Tax=Candidatus Ryanbacteria bacterium RIFCSPHIGHO2_02_FULL_45_13b TaxID=1802117 RepID=A0A1G2G3N0_9BACT|nr:MAG: hypothetical protein A3J54_00360 [Candidatus Ryanbacteria bacterium RIFCSPHIGHO2_02_FULL_45_13b]